MEAHSPGEGGKVIESAIIADLVCTRAPMCTQVGEQGIALVFNEMDMLCTRVPIFSLLEYILYRVGVGGATTPTPTRGYV